MIHQDSGPSKCFGCVKFANLTGPSFQGPDGPQMGTKGLVAQYVSTMMDIKRLTLAIDRQRLIELFGSFGDLTS